MNQTVSDLLNKFEIRLSVRLRTQLMEDEIINN